MLSVSQSAELLHISCSRVRALIAQGSLSAEKIGHTWILDEQSVFDRIEHHPKSGRPHNTKQVMQNERITSTMSQNMPYAKTHSKAQSQKHDLYLSCKKEFYFRPNTQLLEQASTSEEADFYITVADFFLQHRQEELIKEGIF